MIPNAPDLRASRPAPPQAHPDGVTPYFDARQSPQGAAAWDRDAQPVAALEQMFAYYEA